MKEQYNSLVNRYMKLYFGSKFMKLIGFSIVTTTLKNCISLKKILSTKILLSSRLYTETILQSFQLKINKSIVFYFYSR